MDSNLSPYAFFRAFDLAFFIPGVVLLLSVEYSLRMAGLPTVLTVVQNHGLVDQRAISIQAVFQAFGMLVIVYVVGLICHSLTWLIIQRIRRNKKALVHKLISAKVEQIISANPELQDHQFQNSSALTDIAKKATKDLANEIRNAKALLILGRINEYYKCRRDVSASKSWARTFIGYVTFGTLKHRIHRLSAEKLIAAVESECVESRLGWTYEKSLVSQHLSYFWYLRSTCWNLSTALVVGAMLNFSIWIYFRHESGGLVFVRLIAFLTIAVLFCLMGNTYHLSYVDRKRMLQVICVKQDEHANKAVLNKQVDLVEHDIDASEKL